MNPLTHLKKRRILALVIAPALIVGAAFIPVPAHATASCGVANTNILTPFTAGFFPDDSLDLRCKNPDFDWDLKTKIKGDSDLYITEVTIQPGGQTGWHTHPGPSMITVTEGTLTVYKADCTFETYSAGDTFTDLGCGDIHDVRNETGAVAKDVAVQLVPHNAPRREERPDPQCSQVPACP